MSRRNVGLQPTVGLIQGSVVGVIQHVRNDERILRKLVVVEIGGKLGERNQILQLVLAVHHVGKIGERVVMFRVWIDVAADVADAG